jgi:hypothetical protein
VSKPLTPKPLEGKSFAELKLTFGFMQHMWESSTVVTLGRAIDILKNEGSHIFCDTAEELAEWLRYNLPGDGISRWSAVHPTSYRFAQTRGWLDRVFALLGRKWAEVHTITNGARAAREAEAVKRLEDGKVWPSKRACAKEVGPAIYEALSKGRKHKGLTYMRVKA